MRAQRPLNLCLALGLLLALAPGTVPSAARAAADPVYRSFGGVTSLPGGPDRRVPAAPSAPVLATIDRAGTVGALAGSPVHESTYAPETGHNIPDVFARFMQTRDLVSEGGALQVGALLDPVYVLGYPISEAYWATVPIAGQPTQVLIQLYQRRVLTYIPGYSPAWQVQMGNVGQHYFAWRYGLGAGAPPSATAAPTPPAAPPAAPLPGAGDTFIHVAGNQLTYAGQPVLLKGTNYWMHLQPFVGTWIYWDGPTIQQELATARDLGVNTIRIGLPYDQSYATDIVWGPGCAKTGARCDHIGGAITNLMTQLLQIAAGYHMKVLFTLFEWSDKFPAPGSDEYRKQMNYVQGLVAPFANDDRVLGWDLHNEPENYSPWNDHQPQVLAWMANVAAAVRGLDAQHPLTVGVGQAADLWAGAPGTRLIDLVDFASFHSYDAGGLRGQILAIQQHTAKPILLEEMGWPTGPAILSRPTATYDEATQQFLYQTMLADAKASPLVGVIQWMLQDNPIGTEQHYIKPTIQSWFGLLRLDGSPKPALATFRDGYPAPPLPSRTQTNLPLTHGVPSP